MQSAKVDDTITVSHQIQPDDVRRIREAGFVAIINNRPDGEAADQPAAAEIARAAAEEGLAYAEIPVGRDGIGPDQIAGFARVLGEASGPVFAFCRTGTRSINLWALTQAGERDPDTILQLASGAGYDLSPMRPVLERLTEGAGQ
ncbi:TIGR01244 family sulfur transferase [Stappia indica]|uniref:TIGR01244 family sulfur transferase n=1 Tax=Stappia indica TaxID=538381 RepID=UPI001CD22EAC|nr:TIGR01244 family sulfur transferase [Stappia indica]MCA1299551.1 TIGR01244 family phosphatase [Stappia indica]